MTAPRTRILHVITRLVLGGAQENTLLTVARLDRSRYEVGLASGPTSGPEGSLEDRIPEDIAFARIRDLVRYPHPVKDLRATLDLYRLMRANRYDIVHTHTTKAGILGRIAAHFAGARIIVHTPHGHAFHDYLSRPSSYLLTLVERWLARWTDRIICLSEAELADHLRYGIGSPDQFTVIHSGVDLAQFRQRAVDQSGKRREVGLPQTGRIVGCVARLVPVKGVDLLLEAAPAIIRAVPDATLVFVGDGPMRSTLEQRARELNLNGSVVFLGLRRDVPELMPLFDVVVLPSRNEGMGKAAVEALAARRPIVGTAITGIQDIVRHGETGVLVPRVNPAALAEAVIRCLRDPAWAMGLADRAQADLKRFSVEEMLSKLETLYGDLAAIPHSKDPPSVVRTPPRA